MYMPVIQPMDEDCFMNDNYKKNIDCILPATELLINFCINALRGKKLCYLYAERMDLKGLIQLRLTEKCDQRRMYITIVDSASFHELRHNQSLHVTFNGFIDNLIRILQDCQAGKLEISLVQSSLQQSRRPNITTQPFSDHIEYELQFVELRTFKNLVHLSLPCRLAPQNVVLFYMNNIIDAMQKSNIAQEHKINKLQLEIQEHTQNVEQLNLDNHKLRDNLLETTRTCNLRKSNEIQEIQDNLRKATKQRQIDNDRHCKTITSLKEQLEKLGKENVHLQTEKTQEKKRYEILLEDIIGLKKHIENLKEQNESLNTEIVSLKNLERKNDMHLNDARKHIKELQEDLKKIGKYKADVVAELEAERKISQTKRQALETATEEISKANEIIQKQSQELKILKSTIAWRTEIALEQEKVITEKENILRIRDEEISQMRSTIKCLRQEIPLELNSMREFTNKLEKKYSEQIRSLKEKLNTPIGRENCPPSILNSIRHK